MSSKPTESTAASSGVEQLIARLRDQGVKAGQSQADAIIEQAKTQKKPMKKATGKKKKAAVTAEKPAQGKKRKVAFG